MTWKLYVYSDATSLLQPSSFMQSNLAVLILPGPWSSHAELIAAINAQSPNYRFTDGMLLNVDTRRGVHLHFEEGHNPNIVEDFRCGGNHWSSAGEMLAIERHNSYVILADAGGSRQRMAHIMSAASAVVKAGALGVRVENAGIAHAPEAWLKLANDGIDGIFRAFVATIDNQDAGAHSSGMHTFGLRDVSVSSDIPNYTSIIGTFAWHLLVKQVRVVSGETVSIGRKAARFRVREIESPVTAKGSMFHNKFGTWELVPA